MQFCETCKKQAFQLRGVRGGKLQCESCNEADELARRQAENAPSPARLAYEAEQRRILQECHEEERRRPREPLFCKANDTHSETPYRSGIPAVGLNERGELCCSECLGDLAPAKLLGRIEAIEKAMAAQQSTKTARVKS